jgi:hypothetical protein
MVSLAAEANGHQQYLSPSWLVLKYYHLDSLRPYPEHPARLTACRFVRTMEIC